MQDIRSGAGSRPSDTSNGQERAEPAARSPIAPAPAAGSHAPRIVFVHGLFVTRHCWDGWIERYEARGQRCLALAYPGRGESVAELRARYPDPDLGRLSLPAVVAHLTDAIAALPERPILIGHSFGGMLVQLLLQRGLGVAGAAIDSVPALGVLSTEFSFLRGIWRVVRPAFGGSGSYFMSFSDFQDVWANGLPLQEQRAIYPSLIVPESRRLARGALGLGARVAFDRARAPLLFVAGERDRFIPPSLNRTNARRYRTSEAVTDFRVYPGRTHHILGQAGWEEVADDVLAWTTHAAAACRA